MSPVYLSIDIGTSSVAAAYRDGFGAVREVRLSPTSPLMPAAVFADLATLVAGVTALERGHYSPRQLEPHPKHRLGEEQINLGDKNVDGVALVAAVIHEVVQIAVRVAGSHFDGVILTHPDTWRAARTEKLIEAAARAGLDRRRVRLLSESQAAALYYTDAEEIPPGSRICVYDFGDGSCSATVMDIDTGGELRTVGSAVLPDFGGGDLDARLLDRVVQQAGDRIPEQDRVLSGADVASSSVSNVRQVKEKLSTSTRATMELPDGSSIQVTRSEFEEIISADVSETVELVEEALAQADLVVPHTVDRMLLVGGSSNIPLVHGVLSEFAPIATMGDPKMVVAQGALTDTALGLTSREGDNSRLGSGQGVQEEKQIETGQTVTSAAGSSSTKSARAVVGGVAALVLVVGVALVVVNGLRTAGDPEDDPPTSRSRTSETETVSTTSTTTGPGTLEDVTGCAGHTSEQCALYASIPDPIEEVAYCSPGDIREMPNLAIVVCSSIDSEPIVSEVPIMRVDMVNSASSGIAIGDTFVGRGQYWKDWSGVDGVMGSAYTHPDPSGLEQLCMTAVESNRGACLYHDPSVSTADEIFDWWLSQPELI